MYIKNSGSWKTIQEIYIKVSGSWKKVTEGYIKVSGSWKKFWSGGTLAPQNPVTISQSTNSTTYLITLTGTNYSWTPGPPSLTYYFEWSTNGGSSWTTLSTGSAINPAYGSSTSYTHQITTAQLSANLVNTYRFRIAATYGSQSASSSATTTVQGPTNITLTAGDTGASSIPINWTSSTGGYRYLVEYKINTSSTWSTFSWTGTTYETITGLAEGTLYNVRVTPYTSQSNNSTYKAYAGNASNIVNATTKVTPGNLSRVENYNFGGSIQQGFFTTGSNTTKVQYYFNCISIPSLSVPTYTQNTSSGIPYKIQQNLLSYFTLKTWNSDTYSSGTTYYLNNTVWYAGNQYRLTTSLYNPSPPYNEIGVSGQVPTNTTYWTRIQTITYNIGDYVLYNSSYYFCKTSTNGTYPTNTTYWIADALSFQMYATPYNVDIIGNTSTAGSTLIIKGDQASTDPLRISSGPTFSNITPTAFRTTFLPSVYTNQVDFYIQKVSDSTYPTGYNPKVINVSGATSTNHDTVTTLTASTQYLVTVNSKYMYDSTYSVLHNGSGSSAYVTTSAPLPDPPTGLTVSDVGTNRPYGNAAYSLSWTAPAYTGGIPLTGYKIQFQVPSTGTTWYDYSANTTDTSSTSITLTGFGSNLSTNFRVYSVNSAGQSTTAVTTSSAVLGTTVPQAPTIGTATTFNGYATVTYTANATGGKAITSYTATSSPDSIAGSASSGSIFVYSLGHNTIYTFTVTATNPNGTSTSSSSSNSIYGVNIGSVTVNSSSSTTSTITLNFTKATNSTSTRGYLNNSLDGSTSGTSYTFSGSPGTSYSLGLAGTATVNGVLYEGPRVTNNYSTQSNVAPTITGASISPSTGTAGSTTYTANAGTVTGTPTPTVTYQWQYFSTSFTYVNVPGATSQSYLPPSNFNTLYPNYGFYCLITATNSAGSATARPTATLNTPVSAPSGGSVTLSGSSTPGSVITASTSGWSGSPTSYDVYITTALSPNIPTSSSTRVASSGGSSSTTYTITSSDAVSPVNIFRAFATASNSGGTSGTVQSSNTITATSGASAPATPTGVGLTGSGVVSWTASSGATSYEIEFFTASDGSGTNKAPTTTTGYTVTGISGSPYQLVSPYGGTNANWARVRVRARNSTGASAYSGWVPSATTYT